jgi:hypothetical protein
VNQCSSQHLTKGLMFVIRLGIPIKHNVILEFNKTQEYVIAVTEGKITAFYESLSEFQVLTERVKD